MEKILLINISFLEWDNQIEDWVYDYDVIEDMALRNQSEDDYPRRVIGAGI